MNWTPLNLIVRVGCSLAYETTVPTPVLFVLRAPELVFTIHSRMG